MNGAASRRLVRARAASRCEYCHTHEDDEPFAFHIEHIIARKHGGQDATEILAWSCHNCNLAKGSNLSGWLDGEVVPLFHPREQDWNRHFKWEGPLLVGKTKCCRATVKVLNINSEDRIYLRSLLHELE